MFGRTEVRPSQRLEFMLQLVEEIRIVSLPCQVLPRVSPSGKGQHDTRRSGRPADLRSNSRLCHHVAG
jgi:hypothetical protein